MYECIRKTLHPGRAPLGKGFTSTKFHAKIKKENKISKKVWLCKSTLSFE